MLLKIRQKNNHFTSTVSPDINSFFTPKLSPMFHKKNHMGGKQQFRQIARFAALSATVLALSTPLDSIAQVWSPVNPQAANLFNVAGNTTFRLGRVTIGRNLFSAAPNNSQLEVFGGPIAQTQTATTLYGRFTANDQWAGIGQNPVVPGIYGYGMYRVNKYGFFNLQDVTRNSVATRDVILGFGTTGVAADPNQRFFLRSFTGNAAAFRNQLTADPAQLAIGINEDNPTSTLFVNAVNSNSTFRSIFLLNAGAPGPAGTFTAMGQEGNSTVNAPIFGFRGQIGSQIATNLQVTGVPAAPVPAGIQETELTFQDLNFNAGIGFVNAGNANQLDRFGMFFRTGTNNPNDKRRVMAVMANGTVAINPGAINPITQLNIGFFTVPVNLHVPLGGILAPFTYIFSDSTLKKGVRTIPNATQLVKGMRGTTYSFAGVDGSIEVPSFGVIAQEVARVAPDLVAKDEKGLLSVNYDGLSAILLQAIKEQQCKIESLQQWAQIVSEKLGIEPPLLCATISPAPTTDVVSLPAAPNAAKAPVVAENNPFSGTKLLQNRPNPSNGNTEIYYEFTDNGQASILITDAQGRTRKTYNNLARGINRIVVNGTDLESGVYTYSINVNGKVAETRKMIIVK
jgi:Chaperone of endosialidase